jgi:hypothetical protein
MLGHAGVKIVYKRAIPSNQKRTTLFQNALFQHANLPSFQLLHIQPAMFLLNLVLENLIIEIEST